MVGMIWPRWRLARRRLLGIVRTGNAQVITAACLSQMAQIYASDPAYGYVYVWAMIPTLVPARSRQGDRKQGSSFALRHSGQLSRCSP
jgi:hypothetical protein